jgi:5-deoxy-D-glucuronate isomerase
VKWQGDSPGISPRLEFDQPLFFQEMRNRYYTWVLAGEERRYGAWADDPRHAWVKNA